MPPEDIPALAARYNGDDEAPIDAGRHAKERGYYRLEELGIVCNWAGVGKRALTSDELVRRRTESALAATSDKPATVELLRLSGIGVTAATALLHFAHARPFPVLSTPTLFAFKASPAQYYTFRSLLLYFEECRNLAARCDVSMRDLDRALRQFWRENVPLEAHDRPACAAR